MPRVNHSHWGGGPPCDLPTKKACDERYADWQAMKQVRVAAYAVAEGRAKSYRKDMTVFGQLVQVMSGARETITAGDGEASQAPFTRRILAMLERYREDHPAESGGTDAGT